MDVFHFLLIFLKGILRFMMFLVEKQCLPFLFFTTSIYNCGKNIYVQCDDSTCFWQDEYKTIHERYKVDDLVEAAESSTSQIK